MASFEAPVTHNETNPDDQPSLVRPAVALYRDPVTGRYRLWAGALPSAYVRAYFADDAVTGRVVLRDDPIDVRVPFLFGDKRIIL